MRIPVNIVKLCSFFIFLLVNASPAYNQSADSLLLLQGRNVLLKAYDSVRFAYTSDSSRASLQQLLINANNLIIFDNNLAINEVPKLLQAADSLKRIGALQKTDFQNQGSKIKQLLYKFYLASGLAVTGLLLFFIMFIAWYRRRVKIKGILIQNDENERITNEYRKRINELQSDVENYRTQARTLVADNSKLEKEIVKLTDEIREAMDAGFLAKTGEKSFPEKIKDLEKQLHDEITQKKILEQEILEILRKLRGEE